MKSVEYSKYDELRESLNSVDELLYQLTYLDKARTEEELDENIPQLLALLSKYTRSERAYVFDYLPDKEIYRNTFEWCSEGIDTQIGRLQTVSIEQITYLHAQLQLRNAVMIDNLNTNADIIKQEKDYFSFFNIDKLIVVPIFMNHNLSGFIGLNNPGVGKSDISMRLLLSIAGHLGSLRYNLKNQAQLQAEYDELKREKSLLDSLCIDFTFVYYIDLLADTMQLVVEGKNFSKGVIYGNKADKADSFSYRIRYYYDKYVVKESAQDFVEFLSSSNPIKCLEKEEHIAYRFRAKPNLTKKEYFEIQIAKLDADAYSYHIALGFRYIDDIIEKETL